jgi:hypothetical protein
MHIASSLMVEQRFSVCAGMYVQRGFIVENHRHLASSYDLSFQTP